MPLKSMRDLDMDNRAVFMRLDLNVPLSDGAITSDARIRAALPSIRYALEAGARLAVASHLGRPKGKRDTHLSLEPVAARLSELLDQQVLLADDCIGDGVKGLLREQKAGGLLVLENLRFHQGETKNDPEFARRLAAPFDIYVNDAFGASHRAHASIVGAAERIDKRAAGFLVEKETEALGRLLSEPAAPFVAVIGGSKVSGKIGVLEALLGRAHTICIGGAMAYTFLRAQEISVGESLVEDTKLAGARQLLKRAKERGTQILLPTDHIVADQLSADAVAQMLPGVAIPAGKMGLDIGPLTRARYADLVRSAGTLFWNGPMGVFEHEAFAAGTNALAQAAAECSGYTVVGGGDSVAAVEQAGVAEAIDHISTGGGASLEFVQHGGTLPGLDVLRS